MRQSNQQEIRQCKRWNNVEDSLLSRTIRARPQNLRKCFLMVAEQTGRTEGAVANRWYSKVSKDPGNVCFFTASPKHVSKNRKNGMGTETNGSVWRRLMAVIRNIID